MYSTKEIFAEAYRRVRIREKGGRVTVKKVAEEAGFDRHTFYYHFTGINDLVSWIVGNQLVLMFNDNDAVWEKSVYSIATFFSDESWSEVAAATSNDTYKIMVERLTPVISEDIRKRCESHGIGENDRDLIATSATCALASTFIKWLSRNIDERDKDIAEKLVTIIRAYLDSAINAYSCTDSNNSTI